MNFLPRSALIASVAAAVLLAASAMAGNAVSAPSVTTAGDGPGDRLAFSPDGNALENISGGLGAIAPWSWSSTLAALLTGGTVLICQRWLAQVAAANGAPLEDEVNQDLAAEIVLVAGPGEIESEVALALRR